MVSLFAKIMLNLKKTIVLRRWLTLNPGTPSKPGCPSGPGKPCARERSKSGALFICREKITCLLSSLSFRSNVSNLARITLLKEDLLIIVYTHLLD